jgi:hypothetical protein
MKYLILDRDTKQIIHRYEADKLTPHGGPASSGLHVEVPQELDLQAASLELSEDAPVIYEEFVRVMVEVPQENPMAVVIVHEDGTESSYTPNFLMEKQYVEEIQPSIMLKGVISGPLAKTEADKEQEQVNAEALAFLAEQDWKRQRHISQKALGIPTSMSEDEYLAMEQACQDARNRIVR